MHLSVALDGAGWHPAAWREPRARPAELFTARYWVDVITEAERGLLDFVTIEDGFSVQSSRADQVHGRLDAVLIAARAAPLTRHVGLMPTVIVTHTEPFHVSKAIATLDYVSNGRAGVRVRASGRLEEAAHLARTAERAKFDFLFLAEGLRLREQNGQIYDLDVVGRPDTFTVLAALAAVTDRLGLAGDQLHLPLRLQRQHAARASWPAPAGDVMKFLAIALIVHALTGSTA
jgi:alkanesulfonate monooxygenase SsuD/methylene tetrahydromethanopterin reductase-like flavin-dependent oxidoreductase (luciferase family)